MKHIKTKLSFHSKFIGFKNGLPLIKFDLRHYKSIQRKLKINNYEQR